MRHALSSFSVLGLLTLAAACGGPPVLDPPAGDTISFTEVDRLETRCDGVMLDGIFRTAADLPSDYDDSSCAPAETSLAERIDDLTDPEALVAFSVFGNGCMRTATLLDIKKDGSVLRPHVLVSDDSAEGALVACTEEARVIDYLVKIDDGTDVTSIEVKEQRLLPDNYEAALANR